MELVENKSIAAVAIQRITNHIAEDIQDVVAIEEPLEIKLVYNLKGKPNHKSLAVTMRTPGHDEELALGFLFTEGIIQSANQVKIIAPSGENTIIVQLEENAIPSLQSADRNFYTTSSCGVCGKSSIDAIRISSTHQHTKDGINADTALLYGLHQRLREAQNIFESTGALHASALFDQEANLILLREDVGRHNALDKVIGASLQERTFPLSNTILLLSGRASFELIQKASMAGIKMVAAIGAPSSLAVQLAEEFDITLIGFLRGNQLNIYSGAHRIQQRMKR
jgi:FdhD protein